MANTKMKEQVRNELQRQEAAHLLCDALRIAGFRNLWVEVLPLGEGLTDIYYRVVVGDDEVQSAEFQRMIDIAKSFNSTISLTMHRFGQTVVPRLTLWPKVAP